MSAEALLAVRGATKRFGGLVAVNEVSFDVAPGSVTALIGPNGAGKTTLFGIIAGALRADAGEVVFDGRRLPPGAPHATVPRGLVRTFQIPRVLTRMSVLENVMLAGQDQPGERALAVLARPSRVRAREAAVRAQAHELLALVRLDRLADAYAGTLSGGQRKLLELARALMTGPRMILLDEPMAGVNATLGLQLLDHIATLRRERGITFLLIEHDMEVVMSASDTVLVMDEGRLIANATPDVVRRDPRVIEAYLGRHAEVTQIGGAGA